MGLPDVGGGGSSVEEGGGAGSVTTGFVSGRSVALPGGMSDCGGTLVGDGGAGDGWGSFAVDGI